MSEYDSDFVWTTDDEIRFSDYMDDLEKLRRWNEGLPIVGADVNIEIEIGVDEKTCPVCGCLLEWVDCGGCDDGWIDGYEEDPLWFDPGDLDRCRQCNGRGGWLECPNAGNHQGTTK